MSWKQETLIRCAHPSRGSPPASLSPLRSGSQLPWKSCLSLCPALRSRVDLHARPLRLFGVAPASPDEGSPINKHFETQSHGFTTCCIRLKTPFLTAVALAKSLKFSQELLFPQNHKLYQSHSAVSRRNSLSAKMSPRYLTRSQRAKNQLP